jgi:hypothetical protein
MTDDRSQMTGAGHWVLVKAEGKEQRTDFSYSLLVFSYWYRQKVEKRFLVSGVRFQEKQRTDGY